MNDLKPLVFELDMAILFQFMKILKKGWKKKNHKNGTGSFTGQTI